MQRIGVFVCWCGSNIAATVDVQKVSELLRYEPGVVISENYQYMCSQAGQDMIKNAIHEHGLTGIVICSCSPRMHEATFRKTAAAAGINPYMVEIANVREQCSWVHKDIADATEKAVILGRAAIARSISMLRSFRGRRLLPNVRSSSAAVSQAFRPRWILPTQALRSIS